MSGLDPETPNSYGHQQFVSAVLKNPVIGTILERMPRLGISDWYLTPEWPSTAPRELALPATVE
jgi:hypothetical protein